MTRSMIILGCLSIAGAAALLVQVRSEASAGGVPYTDPAAVFQGAQLYEENCASCHGDALQGEADWRSRDEEGYLPAPPHDASGHTWHHPDEQLIAITTQGTEAIVGNGYRSRMIGFGDSLSADDILAVLAFIKSTWPQDIIDQHNLINAER
ncbi:c-type cytochrome [Rhodobacteraceae bacterium M382]|nr:c-type cytochrome [Rhodobacteraceae bacterium M382]